MTTAIEAVESGRADAIVVAYFDRLFRSLDVQAEVLRRVEDVGGRVLAADSGEVCNAPAAKWLSATMPGMVAETAAEPIPDAAPNPAGGTDPAAHERTAAHQPSQNDPKDDPSGNAEAAKWRRQLRAEEAKTATLLPSPQTTSTAKPTASASCVGRGGGRWGRRRVRRGPAR